MSTQTSQHVVGVTNSLQNVLLDIAATPCEYVESPPGVKKRASVAVVIRLVPDYNNYPSGPLPSYSDTDSVDKQVRDIFSLPWAASADAEVLLIKRAAREGDRWTGHVALPGGRRDPTDADDEFAASRETWEEVGLDLARDAVPVGDLPQRVVTWGWGRQALMVLCPYVYLLRPQPPREGVRPAAADDGGSSPTVNAAVVAASPPLRLQPSEIASAHWVPLRALLNRDMRAIETQDVSLRLSWGTNGLRRLFYAVTLGRMMFAAIRLVPSESVHCAFTPGFVPTESAPPGMLSRSRDFVKDMLTSWFDPGRYPSHPAHDSALMLWGLTLGVLADLLELLPPQNSMGLWVYPTFSPPDVRFWIWALSYNFRRHKRMELEKDSIQPVPSNVEQSDVSSSWISVHDGLKLPAEADEEAVKRRQHYTGSLRRRQTDRASAVNVLLDGYYNYVRGGVMVALVLRGVACTAGIIWAIRRWKRPT